MKNYTTKISVMQSAQKIEARLVQMGARDFMRTYDEAGRLSAMIFRIQGFEEDTWESIKLPIRPKGIEKYILDKKLVSPQKSEEQSWRIAWKNTYEWVELQCSFIEAGQAEFFEVFFPYLVVGKGENGEAMSMYEQKRNEKLLSE